MQPLDFKPSNRDQLFFGQYQYSVCLIITEAGCLRAKNYKELVDSIRYRNVARKEWSHRALIEGKMMEDLFSMWNLLDSNRDVIKYCSSYDRVYVYSNDPAVLESLSKQDYVIPTYAQQALVTLPQGVVLQKNPVFQYRTYLREVMLQPEQKDLLTQFLTSRRDTVFGFTNSFKNHLTSNHRIWTMRHHYVEHNDLKDLTMLSLVCPGIIRKTMPIQAK